MLYLAFTTAPFLISEKPNQKLVHTLLLACLGEAIKNERKSRNRRTNRQKHKKKTERFAKTKFPDLRTFARVATRLTVSVKRCVLTSKVENARVFLGLRDPSIG